MSIYDAVRGVPGKSLDPPDLPKETVCWRCKGAGCLDDPSDPDILPKCPTCKGTGITEAEPLRDTGLFFQPEMARQELVRVNEDWEEACQEYNALEKALTALGQRIEGYQKRARLIEALLDEYDENDPFEPMPSQSFEEALEESERFGLPDGQYLPSHVQQDILHEMQADVTPCEELELHQEHD